MKLYYNIYTNDTIQEKKFSILKRIEKGEIVFNKYLVVLTKNEKNHLEFFDSALVTQKMIDKDELFVIGLAEGYSGAIQIVKHILNEVLQATGGTNIRSFLLTQQCEYENRNGQV